MTVQAGSSRGNQAVRFGSVCSGIEAASVAWHHLGWQAAWVSEIEPFPSAVLAHHWPDVPNLGDMLRLPAMVAAGEIEAPDVLVGGTPCQAFSVAGKRGSLEDERGALTLAYVELANEIDKQRQADGKAPCIIVWENVPGVLNTKDNAFGCFLAGLAGESKPLEPAGGRWTNAGAVFGPQRTIAWRVLDAQYFGVAQRRRRVFVVASARDGFDPCEVLFEREGVRRDTAPSREAGKNLAADAGTGAAFSSMQDPVGTLCARDIKGVGNQYFNEGKVIPQRESGIVWPAEVASTLNAAFGSKQGLKDQHVNGGCPLFVPAHTVALRGRDGGATAELGGEVATALRASTGGGDKPHVLTVHGTQDPCVGVEIAFAQGRNNGGENSVMAFSSKDYGAVRRLTPTECERLQGFPDDYTLVPHRNKPAADGPRYKALGNSMAVPVMRWIGNRINAKGENQ